MPLRCVERPNRSLPREFTAKDAARVICYAVIKGHATRAEIEKLADEKCGNIAREQIEEGTQAEIAVTSSLDLAERMLRNGINNDALLRDASAAFLIILGILQVVLIVSRFVPLGRISQVAVQSAISQTQNLIVRINAQRAANDGLFKVVIERLAA